MRAFAAGFRLQLRIIRSDPDYFMPLVPVPLFAVAFLAIIEHAGRRDLAEYALMAPVLIALWALSLSASGEIVQGDRWSGTLEPGVASPSSFPAVVLGRVFAVTSVALFAFVEVWIVGRLLFGIPIEIHHPTAFVLTVLASSAAMAGTATIMAALFVLARSARTFQNSLSYPFYVLGGVLVPVSLLPDWLEPLSAGVFLSWSAGLLRDTLQPDAIRDVPLRLGVILGLGVLGFAAGQLLLHRILRRVRTSGELAAA